MRQRVGVLGGSFHPPHMGHVLLATYALSVLNLDKLIVVPSFAHPFARKLAPYPHRVRMCELAFDHPRCVVSPIESTLPTPSYTIQVVEALQASMPGCDWFLVLGADTRATFAQWHRASELERLVELFFVRRLDASLSTSDTGVRTIPIAHVSSTEVREQLAQGVSVRGKVPARVLQYLHEYRTELGYEI